MMRNKTARSLLFSGSDGSGSFTCSFRGEVVGGGGLTVLRYRNVEYLSVCGGKGRNSSLVVCWARFPA